MKRSLATTNPPNHLAEDDATIQQGSSQKDEPAKNNISLLFHTVDGVIPYMTPLLLQTHFAPHHERMKYFKLGISVREACCVPLYPKPLTPQELEENKKIEEHYKKNETCPANPKNNNNNNNNKDHPSTEKLTKKQKKIKRRKPVHVDPSKPCGYTFEATPLDSFVADYPKVVVPSFDLCQDALDKHQKTHANSNHVMVWTPNGRHALSPEIYHKASQGFLMSNDTHGDNTQTAVVSLYDMALDTDSSKRKITAMKRIQDWLSRSLQFHGLMAQEDAKAEPSTEPTATATSTVWAPLLATQDDRTTYVSLPPNTDTAASEDTAKVLSPSFVYSNSFSQHKNSIQGLAVVGWHHITNRSNRVERLQHLLKNTLNDLCQDDLPIAVLTTMSTLQILDAARLGVNVIGSGLPTLWTKSKKAFVCNLQGWGKQPQQQQEEGNANSHKRLKKDNGTSMTLDEDGCIDMHDTCWVREREVLLPGCTCVACQGGKHSKAYIHHLVQAKEILAEILLFGHNLHHLLQLCQELSNASAQGQDKLNEFCDFVESQLVSLKASNSIVEHS